ncbi:unnamed protein product [Caenorhabditis auriculariae]|uniref:Uncharacterized protein n=1 Tax=Caenorhabditis auriculariae TaxID=2777116 RepID=A0A8S1GYT7_9PELO|nr:unnamed protein product [Caenorhabditis auriculariae]
MLANSAKSQKFSVDVSDPMTMIFAFTVSNPIFWSLLILVSFSIASLVITCKLYNATRYELNNRLDFAVWKIDQLSERVRIQEPNLNLIEQVSKKLKLRFDEVNDATKRIELLMDGSRMQTMGETHLLREHLENEKKAREANEKLAVTELLGQDRLPETREKLTEEKPLDLRQITKRVILETKDLVKMEKPSSDKKDKKDLPKNRSLSLQLRKTQPSSLGDD